MGRRPWLPWPWQCGRLAAWFLLGRGSVGISGKSIVNVSRQERLSWGATGEHASCCIGFAPGRGATIVPANCSRHHIGSYCFLCLAGHFLLSFLCWTLAVKDSRMLGIHDATTPSPQGHVHAIMQKKTLLTLFGVFLFIFSQAAHAAIVRTRVVPLPGVHVTQTARRNAPNTNSVWRVEPQLRRRWSTSKQVTADSHSPFLSGGTVC
jgi:hypothetical protein